jgi:CubicO group peptidase (beta-lactamase class C family)
MTKRFVTQEADMRWGQAASSLLWLSLVILGPVSASSADDLSTAADPESLGFSTSRLARIGTWYRAREAAGDLSGAVVAIAKDGKLAYLEATGFQDRSRTVPMKRDSIFWVASMTKPVTSVAAMILVDDGKLELDAPVARYLPELADMRVGISGSDATGAATISHVAAKRAMSVRDLLRHTSGLVYPPQYIDEPINRLYRRAVFARDRTLADFVSSLKDLPLAHQPGEAFEYSWGVDVLARVVEVASGQPFDAFLKSRIFDPLRMVDTGFYVPQENLARLVEEPEPRNPQFDVTRPRKLLSGGGGLVSTASDYLRFGQMLLNGGELDGVRILTTQSVQSMTTNALPPDVRFVGGLVGPSVGSSFGLGFAVRTNAGFSNIPGSVGSFGWSGIWGTIFWVDPAEKIVAVLMIQVKEAQAGPPRTAMRNLTYGALRVSQTERPTVAAATPDPAILARYVGRYDFGMSTSARNRMSTRAPRWVGTGIEIELATAGAARIRRTLDNSPAMAAGLHAGDLITAIDDAPVEGLTINQMVGRLVGAINTQVRLQVRRNGGGEPVQIALTRAEIYDPVVELHVRADAGMLTIEASGVWPLLDFEKGRQVTMTALSNNDFAATGGDQTRITFETDAAGKVTAAVVNPGPFEQRGAPIDLPVR